METAGGAAPRATWRAASSCNARSSASDSTLNSRMPERLLRLLPGYCNASRISSRVLPTPEKTMRSPRTPIRRRCSNSPPDTISKALPRFARCLRMERLPLAFIAKHNVCGTEASPRSSSQNASVIAARLYKYAGVPNSVAAWARETPSHKISSTCDILPGFRFQLKCGLNVVGSTGFESEFGARALIELWQSQGFDHRKEDCSVKSNQLHVRS